MASPTKLNITIQTAALPSGVTNPIVIPIAPALQSLDSGQQASQQTGFSAASEAVRNILRANGFYDGSQYWYPLYVVLNITAN